MNQAVSVDAVLKTEGRRLGYLPIVCIPNNMSARDPEAFAADLAEAMAEVSPRGRPAVSAVACRDASLIVCSWRDLSAAERTWLGTAFADVTVGDSGRFGIRIPLVVNLMRPVAADRVRVCLLHTVETTPFCDILPPVPFVPDEGGYALFRALVAIGHPGCEVREVVSEGYPLTYRVLAPRELTPAELAQLRSGSPSRQASLHPIQGVEGIFELYASPTSP